jgi:DNA-binding transcriptional MocR family regulator
MEQFSRPNSGKVDPEFLAGRLGVWSNGSGPLYRQLAAAINSLVHSGELHHGDLLPAERSLATLLSVSRGTVVAAYELMRESGVIERRQGSGTRISGHGPGVDRRRVIAAKGDPLFEHVPTAIDLLKAIPEVSPRVLLLADRLDLRANIGALGSVEPCGLAALRARIAERYQRQGLATSAEQIMVTSGAQQAIALSLSLLVGPDDVVLTEHTTWPGLADTVRRLGGRVHGIRMDERGVDVDAVASAIDRLRPSLIALNPHHHNPTGSRLSSDRRRAVTDLAADYAIPLIEDRVAEPLAFDGVRAGPLAALRPDSNVLVIDSISKTAWAGMRIGWVRADQQAIHALRSLKALTDITPAIPSQLLAMAVLDELDDIIAERVDQLRRRSAVLVGELADRLPDWELPTVRGGLSLWARLPHGSAGAFARYAARFGVAVAGGREFTASQTVDDHIRIPFTAPEPLLRDGVTRLSQAWAAFVTEPLDAATEHRAVV